MGVTHVGRGVVLSVRVGEKEERGYTGIPNSLSLPLKEMLASQAALGLIH